MKPRVSVCTQVKNQTEYLKRMIESVRAQSFEDWELVLVDDGSTEDIKGVVESYNDPRIKLHVFPENRGIPHGFNFAFENAVGDYLQPLSADEWIEKDKFKVQVEYLDSNPSVGCVWGLPWKGEMGERPEWEQYAWKAHNRSREAWVRDLMACQAPIGGTSLLMRKSCYEKIGGFDTQFFQCSDLEWFVRFFKEFDGVLLPFRWGDSDQPKDRLTAPSPENTARFQDDIKRVHEKHKVIPPSGDGKVTVGIPVRDMAGMIVEALDSLKAQTFQGFDIIILDDGSKDELAAALSPYKAHFGERLKFLRFEEGQGIAKADNAMLAMTETEFFCLFAADDVLDASFLQKVIAEFKRNPWLEFVASQTDFIGQDGKPYVGESSMPLIMKAANKTKEQWLHQLWYGNQYFGCGVYRTQAVKQLGGWDVEMGVIMDYDMYVKLLQRENIHVIEENLTHTRIHDGQVSQLRGHEAQLKLKLQYKKAHDRYWAPRMKVILSTPFYEMKGFSPYIYSLQHTIRMLTALNIEHEWWELSGDSYVDRAKNTIMTKFLEDPDATDLFIIDSDMSWDPSGFINMLKQPEEIVVGSYPQKNAWGRWTSTPHLEGNHPVGRVLADGSALIKAAFLAGGFMRIKRSALQKFKDYYSQPRVREDVAQLIGELESAERTPILEKTIASLKELGTIAPLTYQDSSADPNCPERIYTEFSTCEVKGGLRWGEDRVFGKRLAAIGIEAWIYPNIQFGHFGIKGWTGNYDKFLRGKPADGNNANTESMH